MLKLLTPVAYTVHVHLKFQPFDNCNSSSLLVSIITKILFLLDIYIVINIVYTNIHNKYFSF